MLSDCAAMLTGSLGMLPSASLGAVDEITKKRFALYEPVHGSAPDIAGKKMANPIAELLSFSMSLRYSFDMQEDADLIDNAIQYSGESSEINIVLKEAMIDDNLYAQVQIKDQGEGISSEHLSRLTERFYRIDKNRSRNLGGTGLGLSIVKHIVNRHNGKLTIESELEKGSTFNIYLPILN